MLHIPEWRDAAPGDLAIYALPYEPYVAALPLLFWGRLAADASDPAAGGEDEIVGLISYQGRIAPADEVAPGELFGYLRGTFDQSAVQLLQQRARERGQELHRLAFPPPAPPAPTPPLDVPGEPTRSRRRRRSAPTEETS